MFKRLSTLRDRSWVRSLPLLCASLILIWYIGPRIAIDGRPLFASPSARLSLMLALGLAWALWQAGRYFAARIDVHLRPPAAEAGQDDMPQQEAELLQRIGNDDDLARRRLRQPSLRHLPRYLILGDAAAGKQSWLRQAGLSADSRLGTAPCQWVFAEQAVVLATEPGLPARAWVRLLRPDGRFRHRPMFNGLVMTLGAPALLPDDELAWQKQAGQLRSTLLTILDQLGHATPVYLIITHCDALPGFPAYFGTMPAAERAQLWGVNLPLTDPDNAASALAVLPAALEGLVGQLHKGVIDRLHGVADTSERARLLGLPLQFAALGQRLAQWVTALCAHSRHHPDIRLRGVYFVSARQRGNALHFWQGSLAQNLSAIELSIPASRLDYFTTALLDKVLLPEAELAARSRLTRQGRRWRLTLAASVMLLLGAGGLYLLIDGYRQQQNRLTTAQQDARRIGILASQGADLARPQSMLPLLVAASAHDDVPASFWPPLFWRRDAARLDTWQADTRRHILRQTLAPYVMSRLARQMDDVAAAPVARYQALRLYLMLGDPTRLDRAALRTWLHHELVSRTGQSDPDLRLWSQAEAWIALVGRDDSIVPDTRLIERTRAALLATPPAPMWWSDLDARLAAAMPGQLTLGQMAGPGAGLVLSSKSGEALSKGVAMRYTQTGYHRYLQWRDRLLQGQTAPEWVLSRRMAPTTIAVQKRELDALYFAAYIQAWESLLADIRLRPLDSRQGAGPVLRLLSGPDSPLRRFLLAADRQTHFAEDNPVSQHFAALHAVLVMPPGSKQSALDILQARMAEGAVYMDAAQNALQHGMPPPADDTLGKLGQGMHAYPGMLGDLLQGLVRQGGAIQRRALSTQWQGKVAAFCRKAVDDRFPFAAHAEAEVTLDDFTRLFRPGGLIDDFFQKNLAAQVDTSPPRWKMREAASATLSPAALHMFQQAAAIRDAFFQDGSNALQISFALAPETLAAESEQLQLNLNGQTMRYAHGPIVSSAFKWPAGPAQLVRLDVTSTVTGRNDYLEYHGAWGLFRLFRDAAMTQLGPERFLLRYSLHGRQLSLYLNANSVNNPFNPALLQAFHCIEAL